MNWLFENLVFLFFDFSVRCFLFFEVFLTVDAFG
jgi:hypothetical protein